MQAQQAYRHKKQHTAQTHRTSITTVVAFSQLLFFIFSSASTASSLENYSEHNVESSIGIGSPRANEWYCRLFLAEIDLAKIALSCHFALTLLGTRLCTMIHWAPLSIELFFWSGTIATLVASTCCRTMQVFVSDCIQKRSLYAARKWFSMFTDFRKLVLPSRTLFTAIEVAGFNEVTFHVQAVVEFLMPVIYVPFRARG